MDLGCHPMYLLAYLCGMPKKITGIANSIMGTPVDENAVSLIEFENGAIGVSETSFLAYSAPYTIEVHGTEGILLWNNKDGAKYKTKETAKVFNGFIIPDRLPESSENPIDAFVNACVDGNDIPEEYGVKSAIDLARLLEATYIAYETGKTIEF